MLLVGFAWRLCCKEVRWQEEERKEERWNILLYFCSSRCIVLFVSAFSLAGFTAFGPLVEYLYLSCTSAPISRSLGLDLLAHIKLPSFDILCSLFRCYHNDELRDFAPDCPFAELRHDLLDIGFYLVVIGDCMIDQCCSLTSES